jgi:hypothetical protein
MRRALWFSLVVAFALACWDHTPTDPPAGPQGSISDGAHDDPDDDLTSNPDFFFLPPMVPDPSTYDPFDNFDEGEFNGALKPEVQICPGTADAFGELCDESAQIARFTMNTGPGSETVRLVELDQHYIVNWHTDQFPLSTDVIYRVRVFVGVFLDADAGKRKGKELGFADVKFVSGGARNAVTNDEIALKDGRTLAIKFRTENDVICFADDPNFDATSPCNSKTVDLSDGEEDQVELRDNTTGDQIGVLSIPPGQDLEEGSTGEITFTLQLCDQLDADIPQFGDCLRITADPPLTEVVSDSLDPMATISLCRIELIGPQNELITVHRQDEETGEVFALPHADDDCEAEELPEPGPARAPQWDAGDKPAGDSPYTSLFRNALPTKMAYANPEDAERTVSPGEELAFRVHVTDALDADVTGGDPPAEVTFAVTEGETVSLLSVPVVDGLAGITWTLGSGITTVLASGVGLATLDNNGPAEGFFDPFWPGLHEEGVEKFPVLLGTGTLEFIVTTGPTAQKTVDLSDAVEDTVELRDENNNQIGVLTIPSGQDLEEGQTGEITFTLELCEELDADIPQFGDCLRITADPPLEEVVGADGLDPMATISLCRLNQLPTQNDLITLHRQDEQTGEVFALPHADDDCEDEAIPGPERAPQWDAGDKPAGDSPYTSLFRNALPVKMDYVNAEDADRSATPGAELATSVLVTDALENPASGARVNFSVTGGSGSVGTSAITGSDGVATVSWTLGAVAGGNELSASGVGIASPDNNGPDEGFDPFWPGLHEEGVEQEPVFLGTGTLAFTATATEPDASAIFRATFTGDALDAEPGPPEVGAWTTVNESAGTIRVRSAVGDLTSKPVELDQAAGLTGGVDLVGTVAGTPPTTGRYSARWQFLVHGDAVGAVFVIRDNTGLLLAALNVLSNGALRYNNTIELAGVSWASDVSQLVEIIVDLDNDVTSLWIDGAAVSEAQGIPFSQSSAANLARLGLALGGTSAQTFAWDDIEIAASESQIAFESNRTGDFDIWAVNPDPANPSPTNLSTDASRNDRDPAWSFDGARIAFSRDDDVNEDIWVMDRDGTNQVQLTTHSAGDIWPAWSPDGAKIAWTSKRTGFWEIWVMDANGGSKMQITSDESPLGNLHPSWSPDGTKIAIHSGRDGGGDAEIVVVDISAGFASPTFTQLTNNSVADLEPVWSPDGARIAFTRQPATHTDILVIELATLTESVVVQTSGVEGSPSWSPDGTRLAFMNNGVTGDFEIFTVRLDGTDVQRLTFNTAVDRDPAWR